MRRYRAQTSTSGSTPSAQSFTRGGDVAIQVHVPLIIESW